MTKYLRSNFIVSCQKDLITLINKLWSRDSFNKDRARHKSESPSKISSLSDLRGVTALSSLTHFLLLSVLFLRGSGLLGGRANT